MKIKIAENNREIYDNDKERDRAREKESRTFWNRRTTNMQVAKQITVKCEGLSFGNNQFAKYSSHGAHKSACMFYTEHFIFCCFEL